LFSAEPAFATIWTVETKGLKYDAFCLEKNTMKMGDDPRVLLETARLYYSKGYNKKEIADEMSISQTQVARLLKEAEDKRIVEIKFNPPRLEKLEKELVESFECLREAVVVPAVAVEDYGFQRKMWGEAAAKYLENYLNEKSKKEKTNVKVGLSGGYTVYEMVSALPNAQREIEIYPAAIIGRGPTIEHFDPMALVTLLWAKSGHQPGHAYYATVLPFKKGIIPPQKIIEQNNQLLVENEKVKIVYEKMQTVDIVFSSVGSVFTPPEYANLTRHSTERLLKDVGITKNRLDRSGVIGDLNYCYFDKAGKPVSKWNIFISLDNEHFRKMAEDYPKRRVVIMGGHYKRKILQAVLKRKMCNVLITDEKCAKELIESLS
jgi:deoxyribonucleoside regulator